MLTHAITAATLPGFILNMVIVLVQTPIDILWALFQAFDYEILSQIF